MTSQAEHEIVKIWQGDMPHAERWQDIGAEVNRRGQDGSLLISNISEPTLTVYLPEPDVATGTSVIVCPGGGFNFVVFEAEGSDLAHWLNERGVTVFVLKYRTLPSPAEDAAFWQQVAETTFEHMQSVIHMAVDDAVQALQVVRQNADKWRISPDKIGILGFSAGGILAVHSALTGDKDNYPSFAASIYGAWGNMPVPEDAPPLFLAAAIDDDVVDVSDHSLAICSAWQQAGRSVELHLYSQGGHAFALQKKGLPTDGWIDRFWEWMQLEGFVSKE